MERRDKVAGIKRSPGTREEESLEIPRAWDFFSGYGAVD